MGAAMLRLSEMDRWASGLRKGCARRGDMGYGGDSAVCGVGRV